MKGRVLKLLTLCFIATLMVGCKGDDEGESKSDIVPITDKLTPEFMNSFRSPDMISHNFNGNSEPIDITPDGGMRVTAARNAFAQDTEITVTGVSDEEFKQLDEKFAPAHVEPLLAYHLDAGLADDEVMSGVYRVEFDLKKMGIPEEMWDRLQCYRVGDDGRVTENASWIKDGKLYYESAQNSVAVLGALKWFGAWFAKAVGVKLGIYSAIAIPAYYGIFYFQRKSSMPSLPKESSSWIKVTDEWGSFTLHYDQQLSENRDSGPRDERGELKMKKLEEKYKELEKAAQKKFDSLNGDYRQWLKKDLESDFQNPQANISLVKDAILDEMAQADAELQELLKDKFYQTPESVNDVIELQCLANRYLCDKQGLKKTWYCYDVFLASDDFMDNKSTDTQAYAMAYDGFFTFICLRNSKIVGYVGKKYGIIKDNINEMAVAMCHETFHLKQYHYIASTLLTKDDRFCEATAIIFERQFADYLEDTGLSDPQNRSNLALTTCEGRDWLAWTLEKPLPAGDDEGNVVTRTIGTSGETNCDIGYMLGEFIQYLLDTKKKVSLKHMWENYSNSLGFHGMLINDFGFTTEAEFAMAYEKFCKKYMKDIVGDQTKSNNDAFKRGLLDKPLGVSPRYCVHRINNIAMNVNGHGMFTNYKAWAYGTKVFQFKPAQKDANLRYNAFIVPSPVISQGMLKTVVLDGNYNYQADKPFFAKIKTNRDDDKIVPTNVVLFYRPGISNVDITDDWWVDVVNLYEPEEQPVVKRADNNKKAFIIDTRVKPAKALTDKEYITGLELAGKDNRTGNTYTKCIYLDECGGEVEFSYDLLGVTQYDSQIDVSFSTRWFYSTLDDQENEVHYYSPATKPVNYKSNGKTVEEEVPKTQPTEDNIGEYDFKINNYTIMGSSGFSPYRVKDAYKQNTVIGHVAWNEKQYTLTIPAHTITYKGVSSEFDLIYEMPAITLTGTPIYHRESKQYLIDLDKLEFSPKNLVFKRRDDETISTVTVSETEPKEYRNSKEPIIYSDNTMPSITIQYQKVTKVIKYFHDGHCESSQAYGTISIRGTVIK